MIEASWGTPELPGDGCPGAFLQLAGVVELCCAEVLNCQPERSVSRLSPVLGSSATMFTRGDGSR